MKRNVTICFKLILATIIMISFSSNAYSGDNSNDGTLYYGLTYSGLDIASIAYSESDFYPYEGIDVKNFECKIVTFSDLLQIGGKYRSIVGDDNSVRYYRDEHKIQDGTRVLEYWFDYNQNQIRIIDRRIIGSDTTNYEKIANINDKYSDSVSLFFRLRESLDTLTTPKYISYFDGTDTDSLLIESISHELFNTSGDKSTPVFVVDLRIKPGLMPGSKDKIKLYISDDENRSLIYGKMYMTLGYLELKLLSGY